MNREEAIDIIRKNIPHLGIGAAEMTEALNELIPELRESEDEKIRKDIIGGLMWQRDNLKSEGPHDNNLILPGFCLTVGEHLKYLEKQKEDKDELVYRINGLMQDYIKEGKNDEEKEHRLKCYQLFWDALEDASYFEQKEPKPVDDSDFKTKLAEYLQNNSPKDGQYVISSESILEIAKEELIKRGELQKPVEWSEEDEAMRDNILRVLSCFVANVECDSNPSLSTSYPEFQREMDWLKSLRPQWKPTKEQMEALQRAIDACESEWAYQDDELRSLLNELEKL